jgi:pimeloyl-ACP methyl ester carboxylesterase
VAALGFSMGASVVLRHAGADPSAGLAPVDAVVAVSSPARWYYRGTAPMRRLHWVVTRPAGRLVSRVGLRTRIHPREWDPVPRSPVESVPHIAPTPLLIVHGDQDAYFPLDHPLSLAAASGGSADLWLEPGFGHAENAVGPELLSRLRAWLTANAVR